MKQNIPVPLTGGAGGDPVTKNTDERFRCERFLRRRFQRLKTIMDRAASLEGKPKEMGAIFRAIAAQVLEEKAR